MKVSELQGDELGCWVAKADNLVVRTRETPAGQSQWVEDSSGRFVGYIGGEHVPQYAPHLDWSQGGPIIERERITIAYCDDGNGSGWVSYSQLYHQGFAQTPLVAAMRCYVASRFGEEVPEVK